MLCARVHGCVWKRDLIKLIVIKLATELIFWIDKEINLYNLYISTIIPICITWEQKEVKFQIKTKARLRTVNNITILDHRVTEQNYHSAHSV